MGAYYHQLLNMREINGNFDQVLGVEKMREWEGFEEQKVKDGCA
jgi:hypothetical protein